jgi:hypothetical protein
MLSSWMTGWGCRRDPDSRGLDLELRLIAVLADRLKVEHRADGTRVLMRSPLADAAASE